MCQTCAAGETARTRWSCPGLVDPPLGLCIPSVHVSTKPGQLQRADRHSLFVIYQHRPQFAPADAYFPKVAERILRGLECGIVPYACDGAVSFYVFGSTKSLVRSAAVSLTSYAANPCERPSWIALAAVQSCWCDRPADGSWPLTLVYFRTVTLPTSSLDFPCAPHPRRSRRPKSSPAGSAVRHTPRKEHVPASSGSLHSIRASAMGS